MDLASVSSFVLLPFVITIVACYGCPYGEKFNIFIFPGNKYSGSTFFGEYLLTVTPGVKKIQIWQEFSQLINCILRTSVDVYQVAVIDIQ